LRLCIHISTPSEAPAEGDSHLVDLAAHVRTSVAHIRDMEAVKPGSRVRRHCCLVV